MLLKNQFTKTVTFSKVSLNLETKTYFGINKAMNWKYWLLSCIWLFANPWTVAHQAPLSMEFSWEEYWNGLPFPSPGNLPNPGTEPGSPALQADSLSSETPGSPNWIELNWMCPQIHFNSFKFPAWLYMVVSCLRIDGVTRVDSSWWHSNPETQRTLSLLLSFHLSHSLSPSFLLC